MYKPASGMSILKHGRILRWSIVALFAVLAISIAAWSHESSRTAHASDTPTAEACFATTGTETKTITDYYNYESNNSANPVCPRDVVIP